MYTVGLLTDETTKFRKCDKLDDAVDYAKDMVSKHKPLFSCPQGIWKHGENIELVAIYLYEKLFMVTGLV